MLPDKISKFKVRLDLRRSKESDHSKYLHSRRRYLINSIPLLSIVALLVGISSVLLNMIINNSTCYAAASTSLTIDGGSSKTISETIAPNETKYVSSSVSYSATDTSAYTLKLTYANGSSALALDNGSSDGSSGSSSGSTTTIPDVVNNTTGSSIKNAWGYSWTSTDNTNYEGIAYNAIPAYGSSTNIESGTTISSTTKQLVFAANLSDSNPTGHYKANVLLSLVATPATTMYTITYDANGGSGAPASQTCTVQGGAGAECSIVISMVEPLHSRPGYTFLGWADRSNVTSEQYSAGEEILVSTNKTLYAIWQIATLTTTSYNFSGITTMQQMTSSICANAPYGATKTLTDSRDNSVYTVVKMRDDKCWMTSNLKITGTIYAVASDFISPSSFTIPNDITGITKENQYTSRGYVQNNIGYYNWYAATAGAGNADITTSGENTDSSICPKNWKLPTGGYLKSDFSTFASAEGIRQHSADSIARLKGAPYNFTFTGFVLNNQNGTIQSTTSHGAWWSSTSSGNATSGNIGNYVFTLYFGANNTLYTGGNPYEHRYYGIAVRCIAR